VHARGGQGKITSESEATDWLNAAAGRRRWAGWRRWRRTCRWKKEKAAAACAPFSAELLLNHAWFRATGRAMSLTTNCATLPWLVRRGCAFPRPSLAPRASRPLYRARQRSTFDASTLLTGCMVQTITVKPRGQVRLTFAEPYRAPWAPAVTAFRRRGPCGRAAPS
jgi:hypothetical protein